MLHVVKRKNDAEHSSRGSSTEFRRKRMSHMADPVPTQRQLQVIYREAKGFLRSDSTIPWDDTPPEHTEGVEVLNIVLTPTANVERGNRYLLVEACIVAAEERNTTDLVTVALFKNDIGPAIAATVGELWYNTNDDGGAPDAIPFKYMLKLSDAELNTPIRLTLRAGLEAGVININGAAGVPRLGGTLVSSMTVTELWGR